MATTLINANATTQVKLGGGMLRGITVTNPGATWAFQVKDGPDPNGNFQTLLGVAAVAPGLAGSRYVDPIAPLSFVNGLQVITSGTTPGELEVQYD